jgi:glyoxylase-like metal-dependent hydrolase (beta-lactamase superfamily II)
MIMLIREGTETMRIADGLAMLEIPANLMTGPGTVNPALLWDEQEVILVDAGFPGQVPLFREAFTGAGVPFSRLSKIILTHSDTDHIGALSGILHEADHKITILAHALEKPYIEADLPPIRLAQMQKQLASLPEDRQKQMAALYESLKTNYKKLKVDVDATLADGEVLNDCGGIIVVHTPGHTMGHICLYHKPSKTLIAGDALNVEEGMLVCAPVFTCLDTRAYSESLRKLAAFDVAAIICYHGGIYRDDAGRRIAELAVSV